MVSARDDDGVGNGKAHTLTRSTKEEVWRRLGPISLRSIGMPRPPARSFGRQEKSNGGGVLAVLDDGWGQRSKTTASCRRRIPRYVAFSHTAADAEREPHRGFACFMYTMAMHLYCRLFARVQHRRTVRTGVSTSSLVPCPSARGLQKISSFRLPRSPRPPTNARLKM